MKTLKQFLEQETTPDPKIKQAEKKENMLKKRVLAAKMRAVRGGATGIMASHEPEGEVIEGVLTMIGKKKPVKKAEKAMDAGARAKRKLARKVHAKYVSGSEDNVPDDIREADSLAAQTARWEANRQRRMKKSGSYERPNWIPRDQDHSDRYGSSKGEKKKPQKTHANLQNEAKVDTGTPEEKEKARNVRKFGVSHNVSGHGKLRRALHRSNRGDKKIKGDKSAYVEMEGYKGTADLSKADPAAKKKVEDRIAKHVGTKRVPGGKMGVKEGVVKEGKKKGLWDNIHAKRKRGEKPAKPGDKDYPKTLNVEGIKQARKNVGADKCWDGYKAKGTKKKGGKEVPNCVKEGAAWTKKSGKNPEGGLNEKGRKSYERENPGSDLKAPQPEGGSRKKSFCARMGGMKKKLTSKKTANDPHSRINKSLRKWKCNEEDKAFNYVLAKLKKQHGDGVLTKRDKIKPQSPAEKAKVRAHQAKVDKENAAERAKDPSQGRYPKGYSNRGSD